MQSDPKIVCVHLTNLTGNVIYDIGAGVGTYTQHFRRNFKKVYAFEPLPENVEKLKTLHAKDENVTVVPLAVLDVDGEIELACDPPLKVKSIRLDSLQLEEPDYIRINVGGGELKVIEGGMCLLSRCKPSILIEVHHEDLGIKIKSVLSKLYNIITEVRNPSYLNDLDKYRNHYHIEALNYVPGEPLRC